MEAVEKYKISEESYQKREDTFAKFKEKNLKNIVLPKPLQNDFPDVSVGARCLVESGHRGTIAFFGEVEGFKAMMIMILMILKFSHR